MSVMANPVRGHGILTCDRMLSGSVRHEAIKAAIHRESICPQCPSLVPACQDTRGIYLQPLALQRAKCT